MSVAASLQTAVTKPKPSSLSIGGGLLQRKCACGSSKSLPDETRDDDSTRPLQKKLAIGASNDPLEQEADRIADQVMATPTDPTVSAAPLHIQRFAGQVSRGPDAAPASVERVLAGSGRPLAPALQQDMGQRFGHDFSQVRVHSGAEAEQSAREIGAAAYTVGQNVVFGAGRFAPGTLAGRRLIAHELTHVVQQSAADGIRVRQGSEQQGFPLIEKAHINRRIQRQPEIDEDDATLADEQEIAEDTVVALQDEENGDNNPVADETAPIPADTTNKAPTKKKPVKKKPKAPPNPCTRTILAEGTCEHLALKSKWVCCDPDKGFENKKRTKSVAEPGKTCPSKKWTPIFTCDNNCKKALANGCDDNDNWMAIPKPMFNRKKCGDIFTICANGKSTTGYVRDSSVTETRFEASPGIQKSLGVTLGSSFKGSVYRPGAKQATIDKDRCCRTSKP